MSEMASTSKRVTVEDASPSPPPLPKEPLPAPAVAEPVDQPIESLGDDDSEEEEWDDEWDPAAKRLPGEANEKGKGKGKGKEANGDGQPWQAVWAPERNAWYFWNANTGEVTWTNPLEPTLASSTHAAPARPAAPTPVQPPLPLGPPPPSTRAHDPSFGLSSTDIDPDLAHLLPPDQRGMAQADQGSQKALFNSRTGRFTASDYAYSVDHLDEYNRAKRMSSHYFDVDAWEKQKAEEHAKRKRDEEMGVSSQKKITKKDMDRFRKKQQERKQRSQAWLRD